MAKRREDAPSRLSFSSCTLAASIEMVCPVCRATVPANTTHHCTKLCPTNDVLERLIEDIKPLTDDSAA